MTIAGGTLKLSGLNSDLINDGEAFTINSGTFDLNGKAEAVASVGGSGGIITNTNASAASLYVGGGPGGTSSASYGGVIQNGAGTLTLIKEGTGTQTLTSANTYSGNTTIKAGTLALGASGSFNNSPIITVGDSGSSGAVIDVTAKTSGFTIGSSQTLKGIGTVLTGTGAAKTTNNGILAPGNGIGTIYITGDYVFGSTSTYQVETDATTSDKIAISGAATITSGAAITFTGLTGAGKYILATAASGLNSGTFTGAAPTDYSLVYSSTELDLFHKADQTITSIANLGRRLSGSTVTGANLATLNNTSPSGGLALSVGLGSSGPGNGSIGSLAASTGSTVSAAGSATITGNVNVGTTLGAQSFTITNTDGSAITTSASNTGGQVIVLADRSGNITVGLGDIGRRLAGSNLSLTGQTLSLTSTGSHNQYTDVLIGGTTYDGTTTTGTLGGQNASITGVANSGSATISVAPTNAETNFSYTPATLTSASYTATAVNARTLTASTTVNFGRYLQNTTGSGSTAVTSTTGDHATLADVTLVAGPTTISGFNVTGSGTNFNGTNGTGSVSLSKNFGAGVTGSQTGSISLTEANNALSPEMAGGANALSVNYNANPVASRTVNDPTTTNLGTFHAGASVNVTSNAFGYTYGAGGDGTHATTEDTTVQAYGGAADANGITLSGLANNVSSAATFTRSFTGTAAVSHSSSGNFNLTVNPELSGATSVNAAYTIGVYSGQMIWNGGTGTYATGSNWTDSVTGGAQVAPGLDGSFVGVDSATFNGTGGTVSLSGATPSLNQLTFNNNGSYTIDQNSSGGIPMPGARAAKTLPPTTPPTRPRLNWPATTTGWML